MFFFCLELSGQEKIFIGQDHNNVTKHVKSLKSYNEIDFEDTILIETKDSANNDHYYIILKRTNKCISQLHIYNDPIELLNTLHVFENIKVIEKTKHREGKYYRNYYEYVKKGTILQPIP